MHRSRWAGKVGGAPSSARISTGSRVQMTDEMVQRP
jgi:hypothetical protein